MNPNAAPRAICAPWWRHNAPLVQRFPTLTGEHRADILVIGAGLTGLSVAIESARRGYDVIVCDAEAIGAGTTSGSTGHLDAHPEGAPRALLEKLGEQDAAAYTQLRLQAIDTVERHAGTATAFTRVPAYYYSESADDAKEMDQEREAAATLGLDVDACDRIPFPRAACGYRIRNMARINVVGYLDHLVDIARELGVRIFEKSLVEGPTSEPCTALRAGSGRVTFDHVICATHCNFTAAPLLFAATPPYQSYAIVAKVRDLPDDALFWDNSDPYFYARRVDGVQEALVLLGGADHRTGTGDPQASLDGLEQWARERFEVDTIVHRWSAELFEPTDGLPMIGRAPGMDNVWVVTGLSGIGLTVGTMSATMILDAITGQESALHARFSPARLALSTDWLTAQARAIANVAERVLPMSAVHVETLKAGEGRVGLVDGVRVAVCRDMQHRVHACSPVCTHMGGVVHWNAVEQSWDCPLHGGRFSPDGIRLYGPPERDLGAAD